MAFAMRAAGIAGLSVAKIGLAGRAPDRAYVQQAWCG